jgi:hypothetical protein
MSIISRQEKLNGKWITWIPLPNLSCLFFETEHQMTEEEAQLKLDEALNPPEESDGIPD